MSSTIYNPSGDTLAKRSRSMVEFVLLVSLLCVAVAHRVSTVGPLIYWPDTIGYWTQARQIAEGLSYSTEFHRASRLGVVLPVALFQHLAGTTVTQFYLFAGLQSIAQVVLVFLMTRLYGGPYLATFAGALFLGWSLENFDGSYITADGMAGVWVALSFYLMVFYATRGKGWWVAYLSVIALACAYLTKITSVFFVPGLFLLWYKRNPQWYRNKASILFLGVAAASFVAIERVALVLVTGAGHSVMSLTERSYGRSGKLRPLSLFDYLLRPTDLPSEQCVWFGCTIVLCLIFASRKALRARSEACLLVAASIFLLAMFYIPKSVFPLTPAALIRPRYYSAVLPIISVALVVGVSTLLGCLHLSSACLTWGRALSVGALSLVGIASLERTPRGLQTFASVTRQSSIVTESYERGETIFARHDRAGKYLLNAARWLLIPGPGEPSPIREEGSFYVVTRPDSISGGGTGCLRMKGSLKERTRRNKHNQLVKVAALPALADTFLSSERVAPDLCPYSKAPL